MNSILILSRTANNSWSLSWMVLLCFSYVWTMLSSRTLHEVLICSSRAFLKSKRSKTTAKKIFFTLTPFWINKLFETISLSRCFDFGGKPIKGAKKKSTTRKKFRISNLNNFVFRLFRHLVMLSSRTLHEVLICSSRAFLKSKRSKTTTKEILFTLTPFLDK